MAACSPRNAEWPNTRCRISSARGCWGTDMPLGYRAPPGRPIGQPRPGASEITPLTPRAGPARRQCPTPAVDFPAPGAQLNETMKPAPVSTTSAPRQARRAIDAAMARDRGRLIGLWSKWNEAPEIGRASCRGRVSGWEEGGRPKQKHALAAAPYTHQQ